MYSNSLFSTVTKVYSLDKEGSMKLYRLILCSGKERYSLCGLVR